MSGDLDAVRWARWIDDVCAAMGVDPALVDVDAIHGLSGIIARDVVRPMAPVGAFIWGVACARHPEVDRVRLGEAIARAVPASVAS